MGIPIIGASGQVADVFKTPDDVARLMVDGVAHSAINIATEAGKAWSWSNVSYDYTAADTILLVQNLSETELLHVAKVYLSGDTSGEVVIHCPDEVTPTGTAVTGINLNRRYAGVTALSLAKADETNNTQANVVWCGRILANTVWEADFEAGIRLGYLDSFAVDFVVEGAACNVTVLGYFETPK